MLTPEKKLDRKFLAFLYNDSVNDIACLFENFIAQTPDELARIRFLLTGNYLNRATQHINGLAEELNAIGLPSLAVKLQKVAVYIDFRKPTTAKGLFNEFESELREYMPAIMRELSRQKACRQYIKINPVRTIGA